MSDFLAEMEARRLRAERPSAPTAAVIVLFLVAFVASVVAAAVAMEAAATLVSGVGGPSASTDYVVRAGAGVLAVIAVLGGLLFFAFLRPRRPDWSLPVLGGLTAMVLAVVFGFSILGGFGLERARQEQVAMGEIRRVMRVIEEGDYDIDLTDTRPKARGQAGEVEKLFKEISLDFLNVGKSYEDDLKTLDIDNISPEQLKRQDLRDVTARLRKAGARTSTYREEVTACFARAKKRMESSKAAATATGAALQDFRDELDKSAERVDQLITLQERLIALNADQIEFLRTHRWAAQNGSFMFYSVADMNAFNKRATEIDRLIREIHGYQDSARQRMRDFNRR